MQPTLIDIDRSTYWLCHVRLRGITYDTVNPMRLDMSILDQRVKAADHDTDESLEKAVLKLGREIVARILVPKDGADLGSVIDSLSVHELQLIIMQYTMVALQAKGHSIDAYLSGGFNLIEESDTTRSAPTTQARASNLPMGNFTPSGAASAD